MPYRKIILANDEVYHILNRGVAQTPIFNLSKEYIRFLNLMEFYCYTHPSLSFSRYKRLSQEEKRRLKEDVKRKNSLLVEIFAYCLMPNHFHLLIKQIKDKGISKLLSRLQNGYAKYFNLTNKRQGPLFQSMFKAIRVETDAQLLHISRYIHLNPSTSYLVEINNLSTYLWSSFPEYLGERPFSYIKAGTILDMIGGKEKYKKFIFNQAEYQRKLNIIRHLALEKP
ncbi:hypothetical protein FJY90_08265 [Candidatus Gottesmanbacteria bacterium]|nr:hypothetical protein [Candidatus Gottesmanbacteria bacterium]